MKSILCYCPNHLDVISFYRMHGPLGELEKKGLIKTRNASNTLEDFTDWTLFTKSDILFIQRPCKKYNAKMVEVAKKYGLKIWSDFDDDLLHLPDDNDAYNLFSSVEARETQKYVIDNSDAISFATPYLAEVYRKHYSIAEEKIHVIPNAIPPQFLKYKKPFKYEKKVSWRGSASHLPELMHHAPDLISFLNRYPEWEFHFWGVNPYFIYRYVKAPNVRICKDLNLIDFIHALTDYNAPIQFAVQLDTHFHRSKSNLAWMDGTLAGSVVLGPNFDEWKKPGLHNYRIMESQSFKNQLDQMMNQSPEALEKEHNQSWEWIKDNILLENVNKLRINLINSL